MQVGNTGCAADGSRQHHGENLRSERIDAKRLGGLFVLADGDEVGTEPRTLNRERNQHCDSHHGENQGVGRDSIGELKIGDSRLVGHKDPLTASGDLE